MHAVLRDRGQADQESRWGPSRDTAWATSTSTSGPLACSVAQVGPSAPELLEGPDSGVSLAKPLPLASVQSCSPPTRWPNAQEPRGEEGLALARNVAPDHAGLGWSLVPGSQAG